MNRGSRLRLVVLVALVSSMTTLGMVSTSQAYTFPSGDWWAIDASNHDAWEIEDMPSEGKMWWRAQFYWDENNWPEDHWDWFTWVDEWYMHEFRRFEYQNVGDAYDYDVMDSDETYYTTLPPPHEIEVEERIEPNWLYDRLDNDEEIEVITKEPCDIVEGQLYVARVTFDKHETYDDYTIVFESEHGNHVTSPPDDYKEIERIHYIVPAALSMTNIGTRSSFQTLQTDTISESEQHESPVLEVRQNGFPRPYMSTVIQGEHSIEVIISEYGHFASMDFLNAFVSYKNDQLSKAKEASSNLEVIISFKQTLAIDEVIDIVDENSLKLKWIRYLSTVGGGKISFDADDSVLDRINSLDEFFKTDYGKDFQLVVGIGAISVTIPADSIETLLADARILLVDPGPVEIVDEITSNYSDTRLQVRWYDIFQEYTKIMAEES